MFQVSTLHQSESIFDLPVTKIPEYTNGEGRMHVHVGRGLQDLESLADLLDRQALM